MKLDFRQAIMDDAGLLVDIYNGSLVKTTVEKNIVNRLS